MRFKFIPLSLIIKKCFNMENKNIFNPPEEEWKTDDEKRP